MNDKDLKWRGEHPLKSPTMKNNAHKNRSHSGTPVVLLSLFWIVLLVSIKSTGDGNLRFSLDPRLSYIVLTLIMSFLFFTETHNQEKSMKSQKFSKGFRIRKDLSSLAIFTTILLGALSSLTTLVSTPARIAALLLSLLLISLGSKLPQALIHKSIIDAAYFLTIIGFVLFSTGNQSGTMLSGYSYNPFQYRFQSILMHPNVFGLFCAIGLILFVSSKGRSKIRLAALTSGLALSENRAAIFAAVIVIGLLKFTETRESFKSEKSNSVKNISWLLIGAIFSAYLSFTLFLQPRSGSEDLYTGRQVIWSECIKLIEASPWIGNGPDYFQTVYGSSTTNSLIAYHCHNQFLDNTLNFGVLNSLLLIVLIIYAATRTWNESSNYLGSVFLLVLVDGLFEVPVRFFSTFQNYWITVILLILWKSHANNKISTGKLLLRE